MPLPGRGGIPEDPGFTFVQFGLTGVVGAGTGYASPFSYAAVNATEASVQWPATRNGYLWKLRVHVGSAPTVDFVSTVTVRVAGVNTGLSVVLSATTVLAASRFNVSELNVSKQVAVTAGQLVSLQLVTVPGAGASFNNLFASLELY